MAFGITPDREERDAEYDIDDQNFLKDFVAFSRDNQVLNEEQAMVTQMGIASGFLDSHEFFTSIIVTGGSSGGKSHMLDNVNFESMGYAQDVHDIVYEMTGSSDQGGINDDDIDDARIAYFHELQKIPDEMLEFIKTVSEDGQFIYGRSTPDGDAVGGYDTEKFTRDPLVVVFSFADENDAAAGKDQELRTRTVEAKVDEGPEKNKAVHDAKWGGTNITLPNSDHEYMRDDTEAQERAHVVKAHLRDMPRGVDVVIPYGDGDFPGDDWNAADVVRPMFNFSRPQSTRASAQLAGLTMGSTLMNYHARDALCVDCLTRFDAGDHPDGYECPDCGGECRLIAEPHDVANVIACRETLLATTHGLSDKEFAVLDAIKARGGRAGGGAVQATKQDIVSEIQENDDIATLTKSEIGDILDKLDEHLVINVKDNPEDRRENLYVYDGSQVFEAPDLSAAAAKFEGVDDPIRDVPIAETVERQLDSLDAKVGISEARSGGASSGSADDESGTLSDFGDGGSTPLSDDAEAVAARLTDTLDGLTVPADVMESNDLKLEHMVGDAPIEVDGGEVRPERPPRSSDKAADDAFMSPDGHFDDADGFEAVEQRVAEAVEELRAKDVLQMDEQPDGSYDVSVST